MLPLIMGPLGRGIGAAIILASFAGAARIAVLEHDARVRAEIQASADAAMAKENALANSRIIAGLMGAASLAEARASKSATIRSAVNATPKTNTLSSNPAYLAFVRGMRGPGANPASATSGNSSR
jgi:threonine dehydrogenase-like Zn-dependent dehydrogenase